MAEHDYNIANSDGATVRADINSVLSAIVSQNSKATEPSTTFAYMWWADTTTGILKQRNAANSAWINVRAIASGGVIGTDVQAYDADLAAISGLTLAQGDILFRSATQVTNLAAGTSGYYLKTQGAGADPVWAAVSAGGWDFTSTDQALTQGTKITLAHSIGAIPTDFRAVLVCQTGEFNYTAGDVVDVSGTEGGTDQGFMLSADTTNVYVSQGGGAQFAGILNKNDGLYANLTPANWKIRVYAKA